MHYSGRNLGSASKRSVNHLEIYIRRISTNFSLRVRWYSFAQTRVQSVYNSVQWIDRWRDLLIILRPPSFLISQNFWTRLPKKISKSETLVEILLEEGRRSGDLNKTSLPLYPGRGFSDLSSFYLARIVGRYSMTTGARYWRVLERYV